MVLPSGVSIEFGTTYDIITIDLGIAHDLDEIERAGDVISVISITGELDIRLNEKDEPAIEIDKIIRIITKPLKFTKFFITNTAQAGKEAILYIGKEASFESVPQRTGTEGILDVADVRINTAKEDGNLATIASNTTSLDGKITTDSTTAKQVVHLLDAAGTKINPAKEDGNLTTAAKGVTPGLVMTSVIVNVTTLTDVLNRSGKGIVLFVVLNDLDNLTQNEYLRIVVDGNTVLSDTNGVDVANAPYSLWTYYSFAVDAPNLLALGSFTYNDRNMLMFRYNSSILIQARRAAAGVSGLQVIVFEERIE